ncbi:Uncharacterized protein ESCO_004517 [Escovopsis weberi]|uniref:Utp8 beta-propeller domain-containing protein n=1 Tax=Escovopsis weberi TaxID=150374 RepID=A0A0M9VVJ1_ESCWE|nr:Uncharacterized protein ESCO_004517 [Escovopsis weberi]
MASEYRIHRPYVLATLPKPLDHTQGNIVAREVYGQREGLKKRKRTELVVGVDGETTSIYDVPGSRLITSYPIPPQESFTCPPYSVRVRPSNSPDALRYTFIATKDASSNKITVFKDVAHRDGKTTSNTLSQTLRTSAVRYLTCSSAASKAASVGDVIAVCQDGELVCMAGETLAIRWVSSSKSIVQDVFASNVDAFEIEHAVNGTMAEFNEGIFKSRPEVFNSLPRALDAEPELLVLVSRCTTQQTEKRHLIALAAMTGEASAFPDRQHLVPLDVVPITPPYSASESSLSSSYQVDVQAGALLHFQQGSLGVYDLTGAVPRLKSSVDIDGAESSVRLNRPFVLAASLSSIGLYNYQYRSIHCRAALDWSELPAESQSPRSCQLISYLRSQDLVVALVDNSLVSIQIESPKNHGKRRKEGLLIDSIGRGTALELSAKKFKCESGSIEFSNLIPGTITEDYLAQYQIEAEAADDLLANNELAKWEEVLRNKFGMGLRPEADVTMDGEDGNKGDAEVQELPEWDWLPETSAYAPVDRRWVIYAISQIFSVDTVQAKDQARPELRLILPESNALTYLAVAGHLTLSNFRSAFRDELVPEAAESKALAGDIVKCLTDADLSMTLLLNYLRATKLGEVELLLAIRALMQSMEMVSGGGKLAVKLLKNEPHGDSPDKYEMDLDDLERGIAITEQYLGDESGSRSRGLTLAFTKLWRLPAVSTVRALRAAVSTEDIMSLIYLLRVELLRGAWTSLYIDPTSFDSESNEPPPDGVIALIADLLGRCLDAVGAGGWLVNDAVAGSSDKADAGDFLTALRLEVTAALEGIEEAVYLNGILCEAVRFNSAAQRGGAGRQTWNTNKPVSLHLESRESRLLPLGLKTKQLPTKEKVVSGGEVVQRSMRETGHLISQKVEVYSLEKLAV